MRFGSLFITSLALFADDQFEMRVRPLLAKNCFGCHAQTKMGGLDLTTRDSQLKGGHTGPAISPGKPAESLLIKAVRHEHARIKMPPTAKLVDSDIEALEAWIRDGAVWPAATASKPVRSDFWSLKPVVKPATPVTKNRAWPKTAIDSFVLAKLEEKGIAPAAAADRRTLIRRASYDLTGLPPTADEIDAFIADKAPNAFDKLIDRLLASPRYGERWGRLWLDVARYSDDKLNSTMDEPYPNAFRYRNWVINAFNSDMPYDQFVKAQIAGDLMPDHEKYVAGLGLFALSPEFQDDRVDVTTRGFLGLTVACAQCHDHKFDPIPQKDYYSLLGVFNNTTQSEYPLAPKTVVDDYKAHKQRVEDQEKTLKDFVDNQAGQLARALASRTADYMQAVWTESDTNPLDESLDPETMQRWANYLAAPQKDHPYLNCSGHECAESFQRLALEVFDEKKQVDQDNLIRLGGSNKRNDLSQADLRSLKPERYFLWRDLFGNKGVFNYGDPAIARFLHGTWAEHLKLLRADLDARKKGMPEQYPYYQVIRDVEKPKVQKLFIRGDRNNLGEEVPARFLTVMAHVAPQPFKTRLDLGNAMADPKNPLTARVMVNRIWQAHFGQGIVGTPSNYGQLGERPTHPELLDYLAATFVENGWSIKAMHRQIMLSSVYRSGSAPKPSIDESNRLLWRFNRRRLDAESLRDSILAVTGSLDLSEGQRAEKLNEKNFRRTVYGFVSRRKLDPMLALFDFPNPNTTSEQRVDTNVPLQGLFLMNSPLVIQQSEKLAGALTGDEAAKIQSVYRTILGRAPSVKERQLASHYLKQSQSWSKYIQVLLTSNEFLYVF